jgi:cytochrome c biogenesis protein
MKAVIRFFSSVKLAIILLIILAVASILGTLIPQGRSLEEYAARYGQMSGPLIRLQLTGLYHSVWYLAILGLFALNILVCTLTRLGPKWRRGVRPSLGFDAKSVGAMKVKDKIKRNAAAAESAAEIKRAFGEARYKVRTETRDGQTILLARKRIWGIFGSDIVHLGLLVIIAGSIVSGATSVRQELKMKEGEIKPVPGTDFSLRLNRFSTLYYDDARIKDPEQRQVKSWISAVSVLEGGREVLTRDIEVNHPLSYKGFNFYQSSYGYDQEESPVDLTFELKTFEAGRIEIWAKKRSVPSFLKKMTLKIGERAVIDEAEGTSVTVRQYLPDFVLGEGNRPETRSSDPNNPAALVEAFKGEEMIISGWVFSKFPDFTQMHAPQGGGGGKAIPFSVLEAAKDKGVGLIWLGCILLMAGLGLAFYWPTWEVRAVLEDAQKKTDVTLGGLASKSREAFQAEFESIAASLRRSK